MAEKIVKDSQGLAKDLVNDTIGRQAAIDALDKRFDSIPMNQTTEILLLRKDLRELPSAQPKRMPGKWIPVTNGRGGHECSLCHSYAPSYKSGDEWLTDYCPHCGVRMESE